MFLLTYPIHAVKASGIYLNTEHSDGSASLSIVIGVGVHVEKRSVLSICLICCGRLFRFSRATFCGSLYPRVTAATKANSTTVLNLRYPFPILISGEAIQLAIIHV